MDSKKKIVLDIATCPRARSRSEVVKDTMGRCVKKVKRRSMIEAMCRGYEEMAVINTTLANDGYQTDYEELTKYETELAECE